MQGASSLQRELRVGGKCQGLQRVLCVLEDVLVPPSLQEPLLFPLPLPPPPGIPVGDLESSDG